MAKIYTKVGDKGQSSLVGGQKTSKSDVRLQSYGTIDELNSVIGFARVAIMESNDALRLVDPDLEKIQHWLFDLGSLLACLPADREKYQLPAMNAGQVRWIEERIDAASVSLPPLRNFILPGGTEASARLHLARTVTRRAERLMVELGDDLPDQAIPFINRLSDYFFVLARFANHVSKVVDVEWKKTQV